LGKLALLLTASPRQDKRHPDLYRHNDRLTLVFFGGASARHGRCPFGFPEIKVEDETKFQRSRKKERSSAD
jgi:hypothetical protein